MEKSWMFIARMPSRATPRITSMEEIRSRVVTGPAAASKGASAPGTGNGVEVVVMPSPEEQRLQAILAFLSGRVKKYVLED
jgi:hypothetical protein